MVLCIVAIIVFGFLGLFSAKYRTYAREAWRCAVRMSTLRPCDSDFDQRMKSKITGKVMKRSPKLARFTYKHFGKISAVFVIATLLSLGYTAVAVYNLAVYGTCDPHSGDCIFNPGVLGCGSEHCETEGCTCDEGCESPDFLGCDGNCTCIEGTCG